MNYFQENYHSVKKIFSQSLSSYTRAKQALETRIEELIKPYLQSYTSGQIINQKEIRVIGMRRTGNHAIIHWIKEQISGEVWFLNNIVTKDNPYSYKCQEYQRLQNYYHKMKNQKKYQHFKQLVKLYQKERKGYFSLKDCLIYSYEDYCLKEITSHYFEKKHDLYLGKTFKQFDIIILRDPFNLIASRFKKGEEFLSVKVQQQTIVDLWLSYAKEFLGETNYLNHNKLCINYNKWLKDINYRQEISSHLELKFSDAGLNQVNNYAKGSSFDGLDFNQSANKMDLEKRWKFFQNDANYKQILNNEELWAYSEKIFGYIPGIEKLKNLVMG